MSETRQRLINDLKVAQRKISTLLDSVADYQDWRLDPERWSYREIGAHLATVEEECFKDRIERIATDTNPYFEYYLNTGRDFSGFDLKESLRKWAATRQENVDLVQTLAEEKWTLVGFHETFGTITVFGALQIMIDHDREHWSELQAMLVEFEAQSSRR